MGQIFSKKNTYTDREKSRRAASYSPVKLIYDPPYRFFKSYVLKGGFRDGWPGFIHSVLDAVYCLSILAKIQEDREDCKSDKDIDREVAANS